MANNQLFFKLSDRELLALLIYGEARGESETGRLAVGNVALNRVKKQRYGKTLKEVILRPFQFSCFNPGDANRPKLEKLAKHEIISATYEQCLKLADKLLSGDDEIDPTSGATHYFNPKIPRPGWAEKIKFLTTIGNHNFYQE